jgi:cysteine protease ATG4
MLIGFLIRSEADWVDWKRCIKHVQGKSIVHVADNDPATTGASGAEGRKDAIDEVEILSDDDDEDITLRD